jgi:hypothetical protein
MVAAAEIARHARATRNGAKECGEDFLYLWFLMKRFAQAGATPEPETFMLS